MKKTLMAILTMALFQTMAHANTYNSVDCDSTRGSGNTLQLEIVNNSDIFTARLNNMRMLVLHKLSNQNIDGITLYTVSGVNQLMEVENSIYAGNSGHIKFNDEDYACN